METRDVLTGGLAGASVTGGSVVTARGKTQHHCSCGQIVPITLDPGFCRVLRRRAETTGMVAAVVTAYHVTDVSRGVMVPLECTQQSREGCGGGGEPSTHVALLMYTGDGVGDQPSSF